MFVVVFAACITATLALLVEDGLPLTGPSRVDSTRLNMFLIALVLLVISVLVRSRVHRYSGTLFYVRLLLDDMPDLHRQTLAVAAHGRMSVKSVTRWAYWDRQRHFIDLRADCADVGTALEATVNGDRDDTGYTIAPNLLWPAALAVGARLPVVDDLKLIELPPEKSDQTRPGLTIRLSPKVTPIGIAEQILEYERPGVIGVVIAFSPAGPKLVPPDKAFVRFDTGRVHLLYPSVVNEVAELETRLLTEAEIEGSIAALTDRLVQIKKDAGGQPLVIAAAMPKVLALALGWHISQQPVSFFANTHLLHFDKPGKPFVPALVHPAQPDPPPLIPSAPPSAQDAPPPAQAARSRPLDLLRRSLSLLRPLSPRPAPPAVPQPCSEDPCG